MQVALVVFSSRFLRPTAAVVGLALVVLGSAAPQPAPPEEVQEVLRVRIEAARFGAADALTVGTTRLFAESALIRFYQDGGFEPVWIDAQGPVVRADSLLAVLRTADRDGLRPKDYHVPLLDSLTDRIRRTAASGEPLDARRLADFELLCSDAFLLYASHLQSGRVNPTAVNPSIDVDRRDRILAEPLWTAVTETSVRATLSSLRPPSSEYEALRRALQHYRRLDANGGWPTIPNGPKLEIGLRDERLPELRARLRATGDLPADTTTTDSLLYNARLQRAVSRFQERHGLATDGVVGPGTRAALNVPASERVDQLLVNLERWRWLPRTLGDPHVAVNIAGYQLRVVENGVTTLQMRVITGLPYRQTPVFSGDISYLVFSPYWHVPHSIAVKDKLPDFKKNPALVSQLGYEVLRGWGTATEIVDPATIDWSRYSASNFPFRLRQRPGPQNALGQVKFMFPNPHSVYLHDTPSQSLFDRPERSFSSGCIRIEKPVDFAQFLLQKNDGWTRERIRGAMGKTNEQTVILNRTVPVHLLYWTAWAEGNGTIQFRKDIYNRDAAVRTALRRPLQDVAAPQQAAR